MVSFLFWVLAGTSALALGSLERSPERYQNLWRVRKPLSKQLFIGSAKQCYSFWNQILVHRFNEIKYPSPPQTCVDGIPQKLQVFHRNYMEACRVGSKPLPHCRRAWLVYRAALRVQHEKPVKTGETLAWLWDRFIYRLETDAAGLKAVAEPLLRYKSLTPLARQAQYAGSLLAASKKGDGADWGEVDRFWLAWKKQAANSAQPKEVKLVQLYLQSGDKNALRAQSGTLYKQRPHSPIPLYFLGVSEFRAGNRESAVYYTQLALQRVSNGFRNSERLIKETLHRLRTAHPSPYGQKPVEFVRETLWDELL